MIGTRTTPPAARDPSHHGHVARQEFSRCPLRPRARSEVADARPRGSSSELIRVAPGRDAEDFEASSCSPPQVVRAGVALAVSSRSVYSRTSLTRWDRGSKGQDTCGFVGPGLRAVRDRGGSPSRAWRAPQAADLHWRERCPPRQAADPGTIEAAEWARVPSLREASEG